jgi:hypothetical protein
MWSKKIALLVSIGSFVGASIAGCLLITDALAKDSNGTMIQQAQRNTLLREEIAINIPNFSPSSSFANGVLEVVLPQALLAGPINEVLRANEGRIKATEFQLVDISNMRFSLIEEDIDRCGNRPNCLLNRGPRSSGFRVEGEWRFQFRERAVYNPFAGHWSHTPWTSVSGTFSQPFYFSVSNSALSLQPGGITIRGSRWYADAVASIAGIFDVHGSVMQSLRNGLQDINGLNLRQLLVQYGSSAVERVIPYVTSEGSVRSFIEQSVGDIGVRVSEGTLRISAQLPYPSRDIGEQLNSIYQDVLERDVTSAELNHYANVFSRGGTLGQIRREVIRSQETQNSVNRLYREALGRDATSNEMLEAFQVMEEGYSLHTVRTLYVPNEPQNPSNSPTSNEAYNNQSVITLQHQFSGKCLQITAQDNGSPVSIGDCNNGFNQLWKLTADGQLQNQMGGKCLQTMGQDQENGSPVNIWDCTNTSNQFWR